MGGKLSVRPSAPMYRTPVNCNTKHFSRPFFVGERATTAPTMQESAQFSAMATELSDQDTVGTAITLQMALGFTVTVVGIFAIPLVEVSKQNVSPLVRAEHTFWMYECFEQVNSVPPR